MKEGKRKYMNESSISLTYLYPTLLNIYGDKGNILALLYKCNAIGINLNVQTIGLNDPINMETDIVFIGGGQDQQQILVAEDLQKKKEKLIELIESNIVFLGICGGYQLLGKYFKTKNNFEIKGIEALDLHTIAGNKRMIGNVLCKEIESKKTIVGFENHSGKTYLGKSISPFAKVIRGCGNNGEDGFEGVRYKNVFGTYLHGSLLPKNPHLTEKLIRLAMERKGLKMPNTKIDDLLENQAHEKALHLHY